MSEFTELMEEKYPDLDVMHEDDVSQIFHDLIDQIEDIDAQIEAYGADNKAWYHSAKRAKYHLVRERNWFKATTKRKSEKDKLKGQIYCLTKNLEFAEQRIKELTSETELTNS